MPVDMVYMECGDNGNLLSICTKGENIDDSSFFYSLLFSKDAFLDLSDRINKGPCDGSLYFVMEYEELLILKSIINNSAKSTGEITSCKVNT